MKRKNSNIFVGDRAYQMHRSLSFRSPSSEAKFQGDTFMRNKYFLQGYILMSILYLVWNTFTSTCYTFHHSCRYTSLLLFSILLLVGTYLPIKTQKPVLVRSLLLLPSLYYQLNVLENNDYYLGIHLIVVQTVLTSKLDLSLKRIIGQY